MAYLGGAIRWGAYFAGVLPEGVDNIIAVLENSSGQVYTYEISGKRDTYLGEGDVHEPQYGGLKVTSQFVSYKNRTATEEAGAPFFTVTIYPSSEFRSTFETNKPAVYTAVVGLVFLCVVLTFIVYDRSVKRRNDKILRSHARSNAIGADMFPTTIADRLLEDDNEDGNSKSKSRTGDAGLKSFLAAGIAGTDDDDDMFDSKPLAEFIPNVTVMFFADVITGML